MSTLLEQIGRLDSKNPEAVLAAAIDHYGDDIGLAMSFQVGGCVLLDMIHRMDRRVAVFSIDTGRLPEQTYDCAHRISEKYGIKIHWVFPRHEQVESLIRDKGLYSFRDTVENRKECCRIRKVEPLSRAMEPYQAWITGRRMGQGETRQDLAVVEPDPVHSGKIKVNPLLHWTLGDLWKYIRAQEVPYNHLYDEGYVSIGCECCTRPCADGEDERAGRWWWESPEHKECGLHIALKDGGGI